MSVTTVSQNSAQDACVSGVSLSDAAARHVHGYAARHDKSSAIRIGVRTSSCSAFAYTFELSDRQEEGDHVIDDKGVRMLIDPKSYAFIDGTLIDYKKEGLQEGFVFENPNVKGTCGCGESFTI